LEDGSSGRCREEMSHHKIAKIISGGQTGADRAGLDVAINLGIPYGGSIPAGRRTEDGTLPERYYKIIELKSKSYPVRTEKNVVDADATVVFTYSKMGSGSALTIRLANQHDKPCLHIDLSKRQDDEPVEKVSEWIDRIKPHILNVAGSRESSAIGIYSMVYNVLKNVLSD